MADQTASQAKLAQYLSEAYGKEKELETSLTAHISMATRPAYKKRLQAHLKETKQHAKLVERRLKKVGGSSLAGKAGELASRGVAAAKGPLHAVRGTGEAEKQLKNAKTEYSEEHEEIAMYHAIEILAEEVGDKETAKVAKGIRREEERMASFLEKQIPILTREVVKEEIPKEERAGSSRGSSTRSRSGSTAKAASSSRSRTGSKASSTTRSTSKAGASSSRGGAKKSTGGTKKASGGTKKASGGSKSSSRAKSRS
jgi:ferritin-like metal-binding protein YciE